MKISQIQAFIDVAQAGSISKAAENNFITTSALSQQIKGLEDNLGFCLFSRTNQGVQLTRAGQVFYRDSLSILRDLDRAINRARALGEGRQAKIKGGYIKELTSPFIIDLFSQGQKRIPGMVVEAVGTGVETMLVDIERGRVDLASMQYTKDLREGPFVYEKIYQDQLCLLMSKDHELAQKKKVALEDLVGQTIYLHTYYENIDESIFDQAKAKGLDLDFQDFTMDSSTLMNLESPHHVLILPKVYLPPYILGRQGVPLDLPARDYVLVRARDARDEICQYFDLLVDEMRQFLSEKGKDKEDK